MLLSQAIETLNPLKFQYVLITPESSSGPEPMAIKSVKLSNWIDVNEAEIVFQEEKTNQLIGNNVKIYTIVNGWISKRPICVFFGQK